MTENRLALIERARSALLSGDLSHAADRSGSDIASWIESSWRRCLAQGRSPQQHLEFDPLSGQQIKRAASSHHHLVQAAQPVLEQLSQAVADMHYFSILTNTDGVVIAAKGAIDRHDRRASLISRIGVDLSETSVGTTAIGTALIERQAVWLHRGEHFFNDTAIYSCAAVPVFGPDGQVSAVLSLAGVQTLDRPELRHLVAQSALSIENTLTLQFPHHLLLRLNWPGRMLGGEHDGLVTLDPNGGVLGANHTARQLLPELDQPSARNIHASDLFALPFAMLFDAARHQRPAIDLSLWSGLRLQVLASLQQSSKPKPVLSGVAAHPPEPNPASLALRDVTQGLIQQSIVNTKGNVAQAALALGISRATMYRKLSKKSSH